MLYEFINKEDWLEFRRQGIGGSEVAAIMGVNPYMTKFDVYLNKINQDIEKIDNIYMRAGRLQEPIIKKVFQEDRQISEEGFIDNSKKFQIYQYDEICLATPDGLYNNQYCGIQNEFFENNDDDLSVLECKFSSVYRTEVEIAHFIQSQWYMGVLGLNHCTLAYSIQAVDYRYYDFKFEQSFFDILLSNVKEFWEYNVLGKNPPEPQNSNDIKKMYNNISGFFNFEPDIYEKYLRLIQLKDTKKNLETEEEQLKEQIKILMQDKEIGMFNDKIICTWKLQNRKNFDTAKFKFDNPNLYNNYLKSSEIRTFLLK